MWEVPSRRRDRTCCPAPGGGAAGRELAEVALQAVFLLCGAPWPSACLSPHVSFPPCSSSGDSDAECPQESALRTLAPGPWGSPASSPEPSSPESESGGPGPRPSPVSSREGSPSPPGPNWGSSLPERTLDPSCPSLLEADGTEPSFPEKEEAGEPPQPGEEVKSEGPVRTAEAGAVQPGACLTSAAG